MSVDEEPRLDLSCWFGLSYASYLVLPRVLMEAMPEEWQGKMADLLFEYDRAFPNQPEMGTRVQVTQNGQMVKTPPWLLNYRYPDEKRIDDMRGKS